MHHCGRPYATRADVRAQGPGLLAQRCRKVVPTPSAHEHTAGRGAPYPPVAGAESASLDLTFREVQNPLLNASHLAAGGACMVDLDALFALQIATRFIVAITLRHG